MAKITLTEQDQALLRSLPQEDAGAVIQKVVGMGTTLSKAADEIYSVLMSNLAARENARNRKRKSRCNIKAAAGEEK